MGGGPWPILCSQFDQHDVITGHHDSDSLCHCAPPLPVLGVCVSEPGEQCADWCNIRGSGAGQVPTTSTAFADIDAYYWLKTPGESDGLCILIL